MATGRSKPTRRLIPQAIVEQLLGYAPGWIDTVGAVGAAPKKGEKEAYDTRSRLAAAKIGLDLFSRVAVDGDVNAAGKALLDKLNELEDEAEKDADSTNGRTPD